MSESSILNAKDKLSCNFVNKAQSEDQQLAKPKAKHSGDYQSEILELWKDKIKSKISEVLL